MGTSATTLPAQTNERVYRQRREAFLWLAVLTALVGWISILSVRAARQRRIDFALLAAASDSRQDSRAEAEGPLAQGANPNARGAAWNGWYMTAAGDTALMVAADAGNLPAMKILLDHGAEVNARGWNGVTALMRAAACGNRATIHLLLARGSIAGFRDRDGHTALDWTTFKQGPGPTAADRERLVARLKNAEGKR